MRRIGFMGALALVFIGLTAAVFLWQNPGVAGQRLTQAQTESYLARADRQIVMPADEKAATLRTLRYFAEHDDGRPVYMLNLMRFYPRVRPLTGGPPAAMSPAAANAFYEGRAVGMLLPMGGTAPFMGVAEGPDVLPYDADGDRWSRMLVIRYPSRRAFLELVADPRYPAILPYKLASLQVILAPFAAEMAMPDTTLSVGAVLAMIFLSVGWARAAGRPRT